MNSSTNIRNKKLQKRAINLIFLKKLTPLPYCAHEPGSHLSSIGLSQQFFK